MTLCLLPWTTKTFQNKVNSENRELALGKTEKFTFGVDPNWELGTAKLENVRVASSEIVLIHCKF